MIGEELSVWGQAVGWMVSHRESWLDIHSATHKCEASLILVSSSAGGGNECTELQGTFRLKASIIPRVHLASR